MAEEKATSSQRTTVSGSYRPGPSDSDVTGPLDPATPIEVTIVLRRRAEVPAEAYGGEHLTGEELAERYGADPDDVSAVTAAVEAAGAQVENVDAAARLVKVRGTAGVLSELFGTSLKQAADSARGSRRRSGELSVPSSIGDAVVAVLGLDDRPQARTRLRQISAHAAHQGLTPVQVAEAYNLPAGDGSGHTIAIIELGGGFGESDLTTYFGGLGLPTPTVHAVGVDGAKNVAGKDPNGADGEVLLDIEVAGAVAPGAHQKVYFAPNTDAGFVDAIVKAAHAKPTPTAMSISWGQSEDEWSDQGRAAMDSAIADATLLGVTVTAAAGDSGSGDSDTAPKPHVDFPASSPHVLACGGTNLQVDGSGAVTSETVWNDGKGGGATGGGVSDTFPLPDWQAAAGVPHRSGASTTGRGVPDVAGDADPETGYRVLVDGNEAVIGGTSAVAPLWAAIACRMAQALDRPRLGLLQPVIYKAAKAGQAAPGFRDITEGSNGAYKAASGWDACTGLGVPDGPALLEVLRAG